MNTQEGSSNKNTPHFYNQPNYQMPGFTNKNGKESSFYINFIMEENSNLKKENLILIEKLKKLKKGVGNKKRRILNEIANLISTKNSFESRFVSEITQCPYKVVGIEKTVTERMFSQANNF